MNWSKRHSENAVAAKARKRMERAAAVQDAEEKEPHGIFIPKSRKRASVTIQIRENATGESLTFNLKRAPWPNRWACAHGEFSSARIGRIVTELLKSASARAGG